VKFLLRGGTLPQIVGTVATGVPVSGTVILRCYIDDWDFRTSKS
jgi:hypothetical protein